MANVVTNTVSHLDNGRQLEVITLGKEKAGEEAVEYYSFAGAETKTVPVKASFGKAEVLVFQFLLGEINEAPEVKVALDDSLDQLNWWTAPVYTETATLVVATAVLQRVNLEGKGLLPFLRLKIKAAGKGGIAGNIWILSTDGMI